MKGITEVFNSALSDLQTINWSETDGTDVQEILKAAFKPYKNKKAEILDMFNKSNLNKFQKTVISMELGFLGAED